MLHVAYIYIRNFPKSYLEIVIQSPLTPVLKKQTQIYIKSSRQSQKTKQNKNYQENTMYEQLQNQLINCVCVYVCECVSVCMCVSILGQRDSFVDEGICCLD